jgi:ABC-type transporter MlaC component
MPRHRDSFVPEAPGCYFRRDVFDLACAPAPRRTRLALFALAALLLPALAGASTPSDELRGFFTAANAILAAAEDREPDDVVNTVVALARPIVAFREAAELALGPRWRGRTRSEQDEFVRLFADLLERAFVLRLAGAAKARTGVEIRFGDESIDGRFASVQAAVTGKDGHEIPLEYRMIRRGAGWAVRDLTIHAVSLVENYQAQFSRIIRGGSYPELVARLREKTTSTASAFPAGPPSAAAAVANASIELVALAPPAPGPVAAPVVALEPLTDPVFAKPRAPRPPLILARAPSDPPTRSADGGGSDPVRTAASAVRYWVQIGAFRDIDAAGRLMVRLLGDRLSVGIAPGGDSLTRVRVGPFVNRGEAVAQVRALAHRGYQAFIAEER